MAKDKKFSGIDSPISNKVKKLIQITSTLGSGCGSVGRAVASDTRCSRFESRHRQIFIEHLLLSTALYWKDENNRKRGREWPIF